MAASAVVVEGVEEKNVACIDIEYTDRLIVAGAAAEADDGVPWGERPIALVAALNETTDALLQLVNEPK